MLQLSNFGFLTGANGALVRTDKGQPITIGSDESGKQYQRVCETVQGASSQERDAARAKLAASGALYFESADSRYRGWWTPVQSSK